MMSVALAPQFFLLLCFKLLWAMPPSSFGHQSNWSNAPAYGQYNPYEAMPYQQAMQYEQPAYPSYGPPMDYAPYAPPGFNPYPYSAPMGNLAYAPPANYPHPNLFLQHEFQYMQAPQYMAPGSYMRQGSYQASAPPRQVIRSPSTSCPSAALKANSRTWDNATRSISSSADVPKVEERFESNVEPKIEKAPVAVVIETPAVPVVVSEPTKEVKQLAPLTIGNKSTFAPRKLAPLKKASNTGTIKTATKATKPQDIPLMTTYAAPGAPRPYQQFVPSVATPAPIVETKAATFWGAKDTAKMVRNQNYMAPEAHVRHVIYYLDPVEYKRAHASGIDPRDLAFAYIMIGQRLWNNVLYPLAQRLGTDFTTLVCHNIDEFEKAFFALDAAHQSMAMKSTFVENLDLDDVRNCIRMYRNRLRICHPMQFPRKFKGGKSVEDSVNSSVLMTHFDYLFKWTGKDQAETAANAIETGYSISQNMTGFLAQRAGTDQDEARRLGQQAYYGGNRAVRVDGQVIPFAKEGETDATLALLYIWDRFKPTGNNETVRRLRDTRNQMAHQEGSDEMYKAYVKAIFSGPALSGLQKLLLVCSRKANLDHEIPQYEVDESVHYDRDSEIEVIEDKTN